MSKGPRKGNASRIRSAAKAHASRSRGELKSFEVPEWTDGEGNPVKVYHYASLTMGEFVDIQRSLPFDIQDPRCNYEGAMQLLWRCARDDTGSQIFPGEEGLETVKSLPPHVVDYIVGTMGINTGLSEDGKPDLDPTMPQS